MTYLPTSVPEPARSALGEWAVHGIPDVFSTREVAGRAVGAMVDEIDELYQLVHALAGGDLPVCGACGDRVGQLPLDFGGGAG